MDRFLPVIVPVDNQVKDIPVFAFHGDELLARRRGAANVVNERQVPVRGQGGAASTHEQLQQGGKVILPDREGEAAPSEAAPSVTVR